MARTDGGRLIQEALSEFGSDGRSEKIADKVKRFDQVPVRRGRVNDTEWLLFLPHGSVLLRRHSAERAA